MNTRIVLNTVMDPHASTAVRAVGGAGGFGRRALGRRRGERPPPRARGWGARGVGGVVPRRSAPAAAPSRRSQGPSLTGALRKATAVWTSRAMGSKVVVAMQAPPLARGSPHRRDSRLYACAFWRGPATPAYS